MATLADGGQAGGDSGMSSPDLPARKRHLGNVSRTAEGIGIARQSLQQKLNELRIRG